MAETFGTEPGVKICKVTVHTAKVSEVVGTDETKVNDLRHPHGLNNGEQLFIADAADGELVATEDFVAAALAADSRANVHFTEVDSTQYTRHIEVSKKMPLVDLKDAIADELGVDVAKIALHDAEGRLILHPSHARRIKLRVKSATPSLPLSTWLRAFL